MISPNCSASVQAALRIDRQLQFDALAVGRPADRRRPPPARSARRMALTTSSAVRPRSAIFSRVEPDAHGVIARAEQLHAADALDLGELVLDVEDRVIAQIEHVVAVVRAICRCTTMVRSGELLTVVTPSCARDVGQARQRLVDPVLHQLLRQIGIGAELEGDGERQRAVGRGLREHVEHVLGAVDLLLQRRRHGLGDHLRIGAGKLRRDHDGRRHDFGIFRDRQLGHRRSGRRGRWRPR